MSWDNKWSPDEIARARALLERGCGYEDVAIELGRSIREVRQQLNRMNLRNHRWGPHPDELAALARDAQLRREASYRRSFTQEFFGDPPPDYSALDKKAATR